jgi:hypothetical protein
MGWSAPPEYEWGHFEGMSGIIEVEPCAVGGSRMQQRTLAKSENCGCEWATTLASEFPL